MHQRLVMTLVLSATGLLFDACALTDGRVLALWTRLAPLADLLGQLTELGLEPAIVTASPTAWHRLVPAGEGTVALWDGSSLAVFQEGRLLTTRDVNPADPLAGLGLLFIAAGSDVFHS